MDEDKDLDQRISRRDFLRRSVFAAAGAAAALTACSKLPDLMVEPNATTVIKTPDLGVKKRADFYIENKTGLHIVARTHPLGVCAICLKDQFPQKNIRLILGKCAWDYDQKAEIPWTVGIDQAACQDKRKLNAGMLFLVQLCAALEKENLPLAQEQVLMAHRAAFMVMAAESAKELKEKNPKFFENPSQETVIKMFSQMHDYWSKNKDDFSIRPPSHCGGPAQIKIESPTSKGYRELALDVVAELNGFDELPFSVSSQGQRT